MRRFALLCAFGVVSFFARPLDASDMQKYFPIQQGNRWNFFPGSGVQVAQKSASDYFLLKGFPWNPEGFWVFFAGDTLYRWSGHKKSWQPFLQFGAPVGMQTIVHNTWSWAYVEVAQKNVVVKNAWLGGTFTCVKFHLTPGVWYGIQDPYDFYFAPKMGMVKWSRHKKTVWGTWDKKTDDHWLTTVKLMGDPGPLSWKTLEKGKGSKFIPGPQPVTLINDATAWKQFHNVHKPGAAVPPIDFATQTVVVVMWQAGNWPLGTKFGASVDWGLPKQVAVVGAYTQYPPNMNFSMWINPYFILVLNEKVSKIKVMLNYFPLQNP